MQIIYVNDSSKKKNKISKSRQQELEQEWRERNQRLKSMGLQKETFDQFLDFVNGKGNKEKNQKIYKGNSVKISEKKNSILKTLPVDKNECTLKPVKEYTGDKLVGIGTMHKSNLVPIFNAESAKDISKMRR